MKKINWFDANRSLSVEVVDFMKRFVWRQELNLKFKAEEAEIQKGIDSLVKLEGSIFTPEIPHMREVYMGRLGELEAQRKAQIELEATYSLSDEDKKLRKALNKGENVDQAIIDWFKTHGLDVTDTAIVDEILNGAGEKIDCKTIVRTNGQVVTNFNASNCFKMVFAKSYEHMVNAGTIKATQIPPLMAEKYAPKQKQKKAKKANNGEKKA